MTFIDTTFDFQSDTPPGKDPDSASPTLRRYHQYLWSKTPPGGRKFDLVTTEPNTYLYHASELGKFSLSSDSLIPSFSRVKTPQIASIVEQVGRSNVESFRNIGYTIGGMLIFPAIQVNGKFTINQARGINSKIRDRFDLTLECIRRFYLGEDSPLSETLERYSNFFALFNTFVGYVDFFLLQDAVSKSSSEIAFSLPFHGFDTPAFPTDEESYLLYRKNCIDFIHARNNRIRIYSDAIGAAYQ
jgi:hypothetical protein